MADAFLKEELIPAENKDAIVRHMVSVHISVGHMSSQFQQKYRRYNFVTPKNYLDYISSYNTLLLEYRELNGRLCNRLGSGLDKLEESSRQLDVLNVQLAGNLIIRIKLYRAKCGCKE